MTDLPLTPVADLTELSATLPFLLLLALSGACLVAWPSAGMIAAAGPGRDRLLAWLAPRSVRDGSAWMLEEVNRALDRNLDDAGRFWSGSSFDRCALFVLPLPILGLLATWIAFGWAEPLGNRLGLQGPATPWHRMLAAAGVAAVLVCYCCMKSGGLTRRLFLGLAAFVTAAEIARVLGGADAANAAATVIGFGAIAVETRIRNEGGLASPGLGLVAAALGGAAATIGLHARFAMPPNETSSLILVVAWMAGLLGLLAGHFALRRGWLGCIWCVAWPLAFAACLALLRLGAQYDAPYPTLTLISLVTLLPLLVQPFIFVTLGISRALRRHGFSAWPIFAASVNTILSALILPIFASALFLTLLSVDIMAVIAGNFEIFDTVDMLDTLRRMPGVVAFASIHLILAFPMFPSLGVLAIIMAGLVNRLFQVPHATLLARLRADEVPDGPARGQGIAYAMLVAFLGLEAFLSILLALLLACGILALGLAGLVAAPLGLIDGLERLGFAFAERVWTAR